MKIKPFNIFVVLMLVVLYISIAITMLYDFNCKEVEKASNTLYDENALTFITSKIEFTNEKLQSKMPNNSVLFIQMLGYENVRGIYFKGHYEQPKLKKGRFFTNNDFQGKAKLAVVGCDITTQKQNGKEFIIYNNEKYYVIGIVGYPISTKLDSLILLSLNENLIKQPIKEYVISGKQLQENLDFLGNKNMFGEVTIFESHKPNLLHIISGGKAENITSTLFLISIIFNIYIALSFVVEKEKTVYNIKIMNGYTIRQIRNEEVKKLLFINIAVIIIGSVLVVSFMHKWMLINIFILGKSSVAYIGVSMTIFFILVYVKLKSSGRHERKCKIE